MSLEPSTGEPDRSMETGLANNQTSPERQQAPATASVHLREPDFLHPSSIIFEVLSHLRQIIVPAIVGLIGAAQGSPWLLGVAVFAFALSMARTIIRYFTLRYGIQDNDFVVTEGLLFRRVRSVPIRRIQNMDLVQNPLHRVFGVAEVNIETASGTKPEATLRVLTRRQIDELYQAIFEESGPSRQLEPFREGEAEISEANAATSPSLTAEVRTSGQTDASQSPTLIYKIPVSQLVWAGLASNRGLVLLGVAIGIFFQSDLEQQFDFDFIGERIPQQSDAWQVGLYVLLGFLALMLALRILGIAWYILRFYDYSLTRYGD